jgi:integrase/recombinase XerD
VLKMNTHDLPLGWRLTLHEYCEYLTARGLRPLTIADYTTKSLPFLRFLLTLHIENLRDLTPATLEAYTVHLMTAEPDCKALAIRTVTLRLSHVKAFIRFLYKTGRIYQDLAPTLALPKRLRSLPKGILTEEQVLILLNLPDLKTPLGIRDRAMLELLYSCGLRNAEVRSLEIGDVDLKSRVLFVRGKGGKEALVPFGREAGKALAHYLHFARRKLSVGQAGAGAISKERSENEKGKEYLFLSKNGNCLTCQNLIDLLRRYVNAAGLPAALSPHSLRHTCATHLLKGGADIRHIQRLLRHSSLTSTQIYTHLLIEDLKNAQTKFHPREKMEA